MTTVQNRIDFVLFFDVENGNPNGDPDAGNLPRTDPETGHGIVTDGCLKRKIRNYVSLAREGEEGFEIYMADGAVLNNQHGRAYEALEIKPTAKKLPKDKAEAAAVTDWMSKTFFDIRTFGAVMTTEVNTGQVRGPVQINFARSVEPVLPIEISITRNSVTNEKDADKERTMGSKHIVPYGLYRVHGFVNAPFAEKSGFSEEDLEIVLTALRDMFDLDRSAARGMMSARKLVVFRHECRLGNAQAHKLFDRIRVLRQAGGEVHGIGSPEAGALPPARSFGDYRIEVDGENLPEGVKMSLPWDE